MPVQLTRPFYPVIDFGRAETPADHKTLALVRSIYGDVADTMDTERSRQTRIGISEIGGDCRKCVVRKLAEKPDPPRDIEEGWKAQIGTFGHAGLEEHFRTNVAWNDEPTDEHPVYHLEERLHIDSYKHLELGGSCDLFVEGASFGVVVDWKFQGKATLAKSGKGKVSSGYRVQMNTYGLGWTLLGKRVTHVVLFALPRDGDLNDARPVVMRYDQQLAVDAVMQLHTLIDVAEMIGWDKLIDDTPSAGYCFDCRAAANRGDNDFISTLTS